MPRSYHATDAIFHLLKYVYHQATSHCLNDLLVNKCVCEPSDQCHILADPITKPSRLSVTGEVLYGPKQMKFGSGVVFILNAKFSPYLKYIWTRNAIYCKCLKVLACHQTCVKGQLLRVEDSVSVQGKTSNRHYIMGGSTRLGVTPPPQVLVCAVLG